MVSAAESDDVDGGPFWAKPGFILAALALAAVALLGVVLAFRANGGEDEPVAEPPAATESATAADPAQTSESAAPNSSPTAAPDPESDCPTLSGRGGEDAITTAPDVQWSPVGEVAAAFSDDNGPAKRDGIKECFAQTPEGALLAAYSFLADFRSGSQDPMAVVQARVSTNEPMFSEIVTAAEQEAANRADGAPRETVTAQGYRFLEVADTRYTVALIHTLNRSSGRVFTQDEVSVEWNGSDWVVVGVGDIQAVSELPAGFISWGPAAEDFE